MNHISINGSKEDLATLREFMATENSQFDFNAILPQPEELHGIKSGSNTIDGVHYTLWREVDDKDVGVTPEEELDLISKYGASNWYDWNVANWGTKWNVSDVQADECSDTTLMYVFDTAWSPPTLVVEALAEKFPNLEFLLDYEEPGMSFWGEMEWSEGELIGQAEGDMDFDEESEEFYRK
jgi:hypothetical protein